MLIKRGSKVRIIDTGKMYTTYDTFYEKNKKVDSYPYDYNHDENDPKLYRNRVVLSYYYCLCTIESYGYHMTTGNLLYVLRDEGNKRTHIVEADGVELVTEVADKEYAIKTTANILGTEYTIKTCSIDLDIKLKEVDAYCDTSIKEIVISDMNEQLEDAMRLKDLEDYRSKLLRHEIIHAFLYESGLSVNSDNGWAVNEEMIDWLAIQLPKLNKCLENIK